MKTLDANGIQTSLRNQGSVATATAVDSVRCSRTVISCPLAIASMLSCRTQSFLHQPADDSHAVPRCLEGKSKNAVGNRNPYSTTSNPQMHRRCLDHPLNISGNEFCILLLHANNGRHDSWAADRELVLLVDPCAYQRQELVSRLCCPPVPALGVGVVGLGPFQDESKDEHTLVVAQGPGFLRPSVQVLCRLHH